MPTLFWLSYAAIWLALLPIAVLMALLYRNVGLAAMGTLEGVQRDGLALGAAAPTIGGVTADGQEVAWAPRGARPHLVLFAAPDCQPCADVLPHVGRLARAAGERLGVAVVVPGPREEVETLVARYRPAFLCLAEDASGAANRYKVRVTPFAFVVGADGRVLAKGLCGGPDRLRALLRAAGLGSLAEESLVEAPPRAARTGTDPLVLAGGHAR